MPVNRFPLNELSADYRWVSVDFGIVVVLLNFYFMFINFIQPWPGYFNNKKAKIIYSCKYIVI